MRTFETLVVAHLMTGILALPGAAAEYACPSDPGFCYLDVGNDGCFDAGTDDGPIDDDLQSGTFPPVGPPGPGSIVCPPSVRSLTIDEFFFWETAPGGDVAIHGATVVEKAFTGVPFAEIRAGRDILIGGRFKTYGLVLEASRDIVVEGTIDTKTLFFTSPLGVVATATDGNIVIGPRGKLRAGDIVLTTSSGGDVRILDGSYIGRSSGELANYLSVDSSGDLSIENATIQKTVAFLYAQNIHGVGKVNLKLKESAAPSSLNAAGDITMERLSISIEDEGRFGMTGANVTIGVPDAAGKIRPSKIRASRVDVDATGDVRLTEFRVTSKRLDVTTTGTLVEILDGLVVNSTKFGPGSGTFNVSAGAGSTCDLSGTIVLDHTLTATCDTVIGP